MIKLRDAFAISSDDVFLAASQLGVDLTTADADALHAQLDAGDRDRIAKLALNAGVDLGAQTLAAQEAISTILTEKRFLVGEHGQLAVKLPHVTPTSASSVLYAIGGAVLRDKTITLYEPIRLEPGETHAEYVTLVRDGLQPFDVGRSKVTEREGRCFIEALSAPGNQLTYTYMLMRPVAEVDRETCSIRQLPLATAIAGITHWDRYEVDQQPGRYFTTMRNDNGQTAYLLGPFRQHIDAVLLTDRARKHVVETHTDGCWFHYGTARLADSPSSPLQGKLNDTLLTHEEQERLLVRPVVLQCDAAPVPALG